MSEDSDYVNTLLGKSFSPHFSLVSYNAPVLRFLLLLEKKESNQLIGVIHMLVIVVLFRDLVASYTLELLFLPLSQSN